MTPVLKQPGRFRCHMPLLWVGYHSPLIDLLPNGIDDSGMIVLLVVGREALHFIKDQLGLDGRTFAFPGFWYRCNELCFAARGNDVVRGLALVIELPMVTGIAVRRV